MQQPEPSPELCPEETRDGPDGSVTFRASEYATLDAYNGDGYQLAGIDPDAPSYRPGDAGRYTLVSYGQGFGRTKLFGPARDAAALERAKAWVVAHAADLADSDAAAELDDDDA